MFLTETHLHTSEVSCCGKLTAAEMIERYHKAGYHTVFVSDHLSAGHLSRFGDVSWEEKIELFFSGYENAKKVGEALGMVVLPAAELHLYEGPNHYLLYGEMKEFLKSLPELHSMAIKEFSPLARRHGITIVQAHPYRDRKCHPTPELVDAIEAVNSNPRHENYDEESFACARAHGLPVTAGSDAHRPEDIAGSAVLTEEKISSTEDYIRLLLDGKLQLMKWGKAI